MHAPHHSTPPDPQNRPLLRAYALAISLNLLFVLAETAVGLASRSLGLVSDAGHTLIDVFMLAVALTGAWIVRRRGAGRAAARVSALIALANAAVLLAAMAAVVFGSLQRFASPVPVDGAAVSWTAGAGILVSGLSAGMLMYGRGDINKRAAFLHMATDSLLSLGVVVSGIVISMSGWTWIDPAVSLLVAAVILANTVRLIAEAVRSLR